MSYAQNTSVSVSKTRGEIDALLRSHLATAIMTGDRDGQAFIAFEMCDRRFQFRLELPLLKDYAVHVTPGGREKECSPQQQFALHEQASRSRWRALFLAIKSKLVSVEAGIETMEEAFLAQIVVPGRRGTFAQWAIPQIQKAYDGFDLPPLLPAASDR